MIIGLLGKARSGKSTVARHLCEHYNFKETAFATALKEMLLAELAASPPPFPNMHPDWREALYDKRTPFSRWLMQFGGGLVRRADPDYWVKAMSLTFWPDVVVSDVRYPNEVKAIRDHKGILVRVLRTKGGAIEHGAAHSSETVLDGIIADYTLEAHSVDDLLHRTNRLMEHLNAR